VVEVVSNVSEGFAIGEATAESVEKDIVYWSIGELQNRSKEAGGQVETAIMQRRISRLRTYRLRVGLVRKAPVQMRMVAFCTESRIDRCDWGARP